MAEGGGVGVEEGEDAVWEGVVEGEQIKAVEDLILTLIMSEC